MAIRPPWVLLPWPSNPPLPYSLCATHPPSSPRRTLFLQSPFLPPPHYRPLVFNADASAADIKGGQSRFLRQNIKERGACLKSLMSVQGLSSDADLVWSQFEATFLPKFPVAFSFTTGRMRWPDARCMRVAKKCPLPSFVDHARYPVGVHEIRSKGKLES